MKNAEHAQLYRELADCADALAYERVRTMNGDLRLLSTRARKAAEEIEGREMPTVDEISRLILFRASHRSAARAILALFGGVEGKS